jgi:hypothetical protein
MLSLGIAMCDCQKLNKCTKALPARDEFVAGFRKLDHNSNLWADLFVCESCEQYWIVEEGAEMDRRSNMAFKIPDPQNWLFYDTSAALSDWIIENHGGLSNQKCVFYGCNEMALNNMMVCFKHGHPEHNWNKRT